MRGRMSPLMGRALLVGAIAITTGCGDAPSEATLPPLRQKYTLAVSIYAGWMPWYYAAEAGVLKKWAGAEGIEIELLPMDYMGSIEAFMGERADACVMTNIEALDLPAAAGIDVTALIIGDYSNGNDKLLTRSASSISELNGARIALVESSVSDYLLNRALAGAGLSSRDVRLVNASDAKIAANFATDPDIQAVVTWNPIAAEIERDSSVASVYDSSMIPGEILDLCVVNTATLDRDPRLGKALVGAWYEVLGLMQQRNAAGARARARMAELSDCSPADYEDQLRATYMFWQPVDAANYAASSDLKQSMTRVREFCFAKHLMGDDAESVNSIGIAFPDGSLQGDHRRITLRFDDAFVRAAGD